MTYKHHKPKSMNIKPLLKKYNGKQKASWENRYTQEQLANAVMKGDQTPTYKKQLLSKWINGKELHLVTYEHLKSLSIILDAPIRDILGLKHKGKARDCAHEVKLMRSYMKINQQEPSLYAALIRFSNENKIDPAFPFEDFKYHES